MSFALKRRKRTIYEQFVAASCIFGTAVISRQVAFLIGKKKGEKITHRKLGKEESAINLSYWMILIEREMN